jgi:hypothetical protein
MLLMKNIGINLESYAPIISAQPQLFSEYPGMAEDYSELVPITYCEESWSLEGQVRPYSANTDGKVGEKVKKPDSNRK